MQLASLVLTDFFLHTPGHDQTSTQLCDCLLDFVASSKGCAHSSRAHVNVDH